ncbi:acetyltransferase [Pricia sp. S334]|uniref:Acetyltransferase n=1 Tax=Pricia mediterranea TaxID=3076079 RepID=A0ABU3L136_9FLAO|nr:acetyltransferase [Pricia sp. S334]MDT7827422.1 acetyltransferase [Pricia sp. S334]
MKNVVIIGASGHGGMIMDCLEKEGKFTLVGFVDSFKPKGTYINGYEILGSENELPLLMDKFGIDNAIVAIGNNFTRKLMVDKIAEIAPSLHFVTTIHPSAIIGKNVSIGKGSVIMPGAIVNCNSRIGNFCIVNTNSSLGHDGNMALFSSISSGVCTGGNLILGPYSALSLGARVIENISIGEHSVVGAGSLVVKDVGCHAVVYGSPARFVRSREPHDAYLSGDPVSNQCSPVIHGI